MSLTSKLGHPPNFLIIWYNDLQTWINCDSTLATVICQDILYEYVDMANMLLEPLFYGIKQIAIEKKSCPSLLEYCKFGKNDGMTNNKQTFILCNSCVGVTRLVSPMIVLEADA